ncbi:MAG: hypothetical protein JWN17_1370 [Frankiales bacterium]|nr:hypothetical protein [Frankiales bacterium]
MIWLLVDVLLAVLALVVLALCGLTLWRAVKALTRQVGAAGEAVTSRTDELVRLQAQGAARDAAPASQTVLAAHRRPAGSDRRSRVR